jgi:Mg-chelatase subunit ChlD
MKNKTHIIVVLDRSGSMNSIADDTIGGFNRFLSDQQATGDSTLSLILFNDQRYVVYSRKAIREAPALSRETYAPRGGTALLDAIGETLADTAREIDALPEEQRPGKVLFVVLTDGLENASREFNREAVFKLITDRRDKHGWHFIFLGANQDAIAEGGKLGIPANASQSFSHDATGTVAAFNSASAFVQSFSGLVPPKSKPSLPDPDAEAREKLRRAKRKQRPSKN